MLQSAGLVLVVLWAATHFLRIPTTGVWARAAAARHGDDGAAYSGSRSVRNLCVSAERNKVTFEYELDHKTPGIDRGLWSEFTNFTKKG